MRLWHKDLLDCLDDFHIVAQWRELLAIKGAIDKNGTPNHRLVNKVLDYSACDFIYYTNLIVIQMNKRNIKYQKSKYQEILHWACDKFRFKEPTMGLYPAWHNKRYLTQCYFNLQEKWDCGIVGDGAWKKIEKRYKELMYGKEEV